MNGLLASFVRSGTSGFAGRKPARSACCCTGVLYKYCMKSEAASFCSAELPSPIKMLKG